MKFDFSQAKRESISLLIGIIGPSGGGKTWTALELANGMSLGKRFAYIDTENKRALHYADFFKFDHVDFREPFSPDRYGAAISQADSMGYPVIVVDSASHEHAGHGGLLDMHEKEVDRMAKGDVDKRERVNILAWAKPKQAHKSLVNDVLLRTRAHVILCFRAEEKTEIVKDEKGRIAIVPKKSYAGHDGWIPITEKTLPYELTMSLLLLPDRPGVPIPVKLQGQHEQWFPAGKQINAAAGEQMAKWAAGNRLPDNAHGTRTDTRRDSLDDVEEFISVDQVIALEDALSEHGIDRAAFLDVARIEKISLLAASRYDASLKWIEKNTKKANATT